MFRLNLGLVLVLKLSLFVIHALPLGPNAGQPPVPQQPSYYRQPTVFATPVAPHLPQPRQPYWHAPQPNHVVPWTPRYQPGSLPKAVTVERDFPGKIHPASRVPVLFHDPRLLDFIHLNPLQKGLLAGYLILYTANVYAMTIPALDVGEKKILRDVLLPDFKTYAESLLTKFQWRALQLLVCLEFIARAERPLRFSAVYHNRQIRTHSSSMERLFLAAFMTAIKSTTDGKRDLKPLSPMKAADIFEMELEFLQLIDHNLRVVEGDLLRSHQNFCNEALKPATASIAPRSCLE